jgi:hypothetical protein
MRTDSTLKRFNALTQAKPFDIAHRLGSHELD